MHFKFGKKSSKATNQQLTKVETFENINQAVLKLFTSKRRNNLPINGSIILEKT